MPKERLASIIDDLAAAKDLSDYEAVEVLWVALVKMANFMGGNKEHTRIISLIQKIPENKLKKLLSHTAVETLINLEPPLETVLADDHERLRPEKAEIAIGQIKTLRFTDPMQALIGLGDILKLIRNKRAHGFKTRSGPRDQEILSSARIILNYLCKTALAALQKSDFRAEK